MFLWVRCKSFIGATGLETRNILVIGVWAFVIIWLIGMLLVQGDLLFAMILFFVAIIISVVATELPGRSTEKASQEARQISH